MEAILLLLLAFPAAGGIFHAVFGSLVPRRLVEVIACACIVASFVAAAAGILLVPAHGYTVTYFNWIAVGDFKAAVSVNYDRLAAVMALMVTFVSSIIHIYSAFYMRDDKDYVRYFCYLNLFVFSMLAITLSDNLIFLFLGWEGVGFCSYALIGFWYSDPANATAGRKAFLVTRLGDIAFGVALGLFFVNFTNLSLTYINAHASQLSVGMATLLGLLLLASAAGKSAQLPLVVWLPDAMAGPTPVSALIHAATMVTAGAYLLMRLFPVISLSPTAMTVITLVAALTALYSACSALAQKDIKRVLAYSTISQIAYMFMGIGAGDIIGGFFHLLTHAFFKALLFLTAGCVIQAMHEDHNIFHMGKELRRRLPAVFWLFLFGSLSLGALPFTAGYFSKGRILLATFIHPGEIYKVLWGIGTAAAFLTALYTFRMFFLAFTGEPAEKPEHEMEKIPGAMAGVTWPLGILALVAGFMNFPTVWGGGDWLASYLAPVAGAVPSLHAPAAIDWGISIGDIVISLAGLLLAYLLYGPKDLVGFRKPAAAGRFFNELLFSGFYLDRIYDVILVKPYRALARVLWLGVDQGGVDYTVVGFGRTVEYLSSGARLWTTGRLTAYLRVLFLGFAVVLCILALNLL